MTSTKQPNHLWTAAIIVFVSFILARISLLLFFEIPVKEGGDALYYLSEANSVSNDGLSSLSVFRAPLYSLLLAALLKINASQGIGLYIFQSTITLVISITALLTLWSKDKLVALISSFTIATIPALALLNQRALAETLVSALLFFTFISLYSPVLSIWRCAVGGVLLGLTALTREIYLLVPLVILGSWLFTYAETKLKSDRLLFLKQIISFALGFVLVLSPWYARNVMLGHGAVISKGTLGINLWVGTWERNPDWTTKGTFIYNNVPDYAFSKNLKRESLKNYLADDSYMKNVAFANLAQRPFYVIHNYISRYRFMWLGTRSELNSLTKFGKNIFFPLKASLWILNIVFLIFSIAGLFMTKNLFGSVKRIPFYGIILYSSFIYIPFHNTETRYSAPLIPLLSISFAVAIASVARNLHFKLSN